MPVEEEKPSLLVDPPGSSINNQESEIPDLTQDQITELLSYDEEEDEEEVEHDPCYCEISGCEQEASYWFTASNDNIYVCLDHKPDEDDDGYCEIGKYSCNEDCDVCND